MSIKDLLPWKKESDNQEIARAKDPITDFQVRMNDIFDDFFKGFGDIGFSRDADAMFSPRVDVAQTDREIIVTAELPGIDEKELDVSLSGDVLTIRGEKKFEDEKRENNYYRLERSYGSFQRSIPLPCEVEDQKVDAEYKNGVLKIKLPKTEEARQKSRRIQVRSR